jgi:hypothetical protein
MKKEFFTGLTIAGALFAGCTSESNQKAQEKYQDYHEESADPSSNSPSRELKIGEYAIGCLNQTVKVYDISSHIEFDNINGIVEVTACLDGRVTQDELVR